MPQLGVRYSRQIILFVICWLIGVDILRMFTGTFTQTLSWLWGLVLALLSGALLWFVRWRAERSLGSVERRWGYYAWYCVPSLVMIAPFAWKVYHWFARKDAPRGVLATVGASLAALLPILLELGVPVILLAVVYFNLPLPAPAEKPPSGPGSC